MLALRAERFGDPVDVVRLDHLPEPEPRDGEVVVAIEASPINPSDILQIRGWYGVRPALPATFGNEGIGRVVALGAGVDRLSVGDRVLLRPGTPAWAERISVPAAGLVRLPSSGDVLQLAMLGTNPPTAHALLDEVQLEPGNWVIQNAANSAVGRWVSGLARRRGIQLINVVRSEAAAAQIPAAEGAMTLVDGPDLAKRVAAATGRGRVPLALDAIGGEATRSLIAASSAGATIVLYGGMSGAPASVPPGEIIFRRKQVKGWWLLPWLDETPHDRLSAIYGELLAVLDAGSVSVPVAGAYALGAFRQAFAAAAEGHGKVLFAPGGADR
jgi:NADPH:quinone reductase-like Zn-dependent oxidoreductase